ncbi:unnamed protein product [Sphagnum balticum]
MTRPLSCEYFPVYSSFYDGLTISKFLEVVLECKNLDSHLIEIVDFEGHFYAEIAELDALHVHEEGQVAIWSNRHRFIEEHRLEFLKEGGTFAGLIEEKELPEGSGLLVISVMVEFEELFIELKEFSSFLEHRIVFFYSQI